jgi:hypothetical protein
MFTKQQNRILITVTRYIHSGNLGAAARVLSGLHRSALKQSQKDAFLRFAIAYALVSEPDFII